MRPQALAAPAAGEGVYAPETCRRRTLDWHRTPTPATDEADAQEQRKAESVGGLGW